MLSLIEIAQRQQNYVVKIRRTLHQNPETRFETRVTRKLVLNEIDSAISLNRGITVIGKPRESRGGIIVDINVAGCDDRILLRADFDALAVREETGLEFSSMHDGISHVCGHDAHTAMLLGFLRCVSDGTVIPGHNLRIVFQDGEENPGVPPEKESGGEILVREGVLEGIDTAYALHILVGNDNRNGIFMSRGGAMMANTGRIHFRLKASGGHAGMPDTGVNSLRVVQLLMNRLDSFLSGLKKPRKPVTLEPVIINAGKSSNVMPADAELWYSFRTLLPRDRHIEMTEKIIDVAGRTAVKAGAEIEAVPVYGASLLVNTPDVYSRVTELLIKNGQNAVEVEPMFGGEDFAHYLYHVPGIMFWLNAYREGSGGQHTATFNPNEDEFWRGVHYWLILAAF